jgi:crotonobetainyl-CoA:carnitine CoA-transferase CaiB-like acyl-CoA transferase
MTALDGVLAELGLPNDAGLDIVGDLQPAGLSSPLAVMGCAVAAVAACLTAAAELASARGGRRPAITLDTGHVAAAVRSEYWLRDSTGAGSTGFAPLSTLWPAADGWVRTHANYPWHRSALLSALAVADAPDALVHGRVAAAIAERRAVEVERAVFHAGGAAVAARTQAEWEAEHAARRIAPLVELRPVPGAAAQLADAEPLPASGVRVLDLTRVIAGPVGTRMLAALGADVLRVDDPHRPELPALAVDGVVGKRSTIVDGRTTAGLDTLHRLVDQADVVVTGYRPGAMRRLGLDADQLAQRYPGIIMVTLSAWGTHGIWGTRRGFDSLVQIATGIGWATSTDGERPGVLPCQLLDHATGYLLAAGALMALARRARTGETTHLSLSLARTARWLLDQGPRPTVPTAGLDAERTAGAYRVDFGNGWSGISPPGRLDGRPLRWANLPPAYGQAASSWD